MLYPTSYYYGDKRRSKEKVKFSVSYERKVKAGKPYEMMDIHASVESDTSIETMEAAYERIREFVDSKIEANCNRLHT